MPTAHESLELGKKRPWWHRAGLQEGSEAICGRVTVKVVRAGDVHPHALEVTAIDAARYLEKGSFNLRASLRMQLPQVHELAK